MICRKCGTVNSNATMFCTSCGSNLSAPVPPQQQVNNQVVVVKKPAFNKMKPATEEEFDWKRFIIVGLLIAIIILIVIAVIVQSKGGGNTEVTENNNSISDNQGVVPSDGSISRTIMIYLVGADLESKSGVVTGDINGIIPSDVDLDNIKLLLYTGGTSQWHNFISNTENAIYELTSSGFVKKESYSKNDMGDANTLTTFLNYGYDNYKTDEYDLIFYNHGGAIDGAIYDDFTNNHLTVKEMNQALSNSRFNEKNKLEVVLFRTCLNGTLEIANELDDYADYMVASEEITNGGANSSVLSFINNIEASDDAVSYSKKFIEEYKKHIKEIDPLGMGTVPMYAVIDLNKVDDVVSDLNNFINGIDINRYYSDIIKIRGNMYQYAYSFYGDGSYDMVDLYTLVDNIDVYSTVKSDELLNSINEAVIYNWSEYEKNSHGLSVYFPYKGSVLAQAKFLGVYNELDFSDSYRTFIKKISSLVRSNNSSNFSKSDLTENNSVVTKGEFTLELTNAQAKDFAEAYYMVFRKEDDGLFTPIYSSDNAYLDGNKVKTKVTNNLIKVVDHSDESSSYIQLTERSKAGLKSYRSTAVAFHFGDGEGLSDFEVNAINLHIDYDKNKKPYIATASIIEKDDTISARFVDLKHYDYIQFTNYRYGILDSNGNYNPKWESSDIKYLFEVDTKSNYELVNTGLDDGDYYAIFNVTDIYGNSFFSNLIKVNK